LGVLGLTSVAMAAIAGAEVIAVSEQAGSAAKVQRMGGRRVFTRAELLREPAFGKRGSDVVITTTNSWDDWDLALGQAGQRSSIGCLGFPGRGEPPPKLNPLASEQFYVKQLRIMALGQAPQLRDGRGYLRFNERENIDFLASAITEERLPTNELISGKFPSEDIEMAYEALLRRDDGAVTYLLEWQS
jgi:threonine dehydrogenase-like Zn-dependent dehydrogenase